ncbi:MULTISPECIES: nucleotidyltransferase family protein [Acinetobacter]|uniref:nucleotidyltransferase family protein n=1 Tax=Acinetobacter TaxID=469 RepID=UPI0002AEDB57|nr:MULTISPECIES: nucleotidyltransferase family protein [Acinetobacter]ELW86999.1 PF06042 family protein [Acinetobacter sp. WC-743]MBJ8476878.1 nucleotidyltransferase family protein [Acinetobacter bereziniae]
MNYTKQLEQMIYSFPQLMMRLQYLRELHADAYLSAGVIRNMVWSNLHDQVYCLDNTEIDVIFYDLKDHTGRQQRRLSQELKQKFPSNDWDVVNQAYVHLWYKTDDGNAISQYSSLFDALSVWVETSTAIAVRLQQSGQLEWIAPFGLNDLFELKLRWNARLVSYATFVQRIASKRFLQRWDKLVIVDQPFRDQE